MSNMKTCWHWFLAACALLPLAVSAALATMLEWHNEAGFRWAEVQPPKNGSTGFTLLPPKQTGLGFTNSLDELEGAANRVLFNGSGITAGDFDSDGLPDIFVCGLDTPNALYKNLGNWRFRDVTAETGLSFTGKFFRGAVLADLNGDSWLDLLVATTGRGVLCYLNDGKGKFSEATSFAGTGSSFGSVTLALADVDGDGTLDLYVTNNRTDDIRDRGQVDVAMRNGQLVIPPSLQGRLAAAGGNVLEYGEPDQLYLNDGKGHFSPVSWTNGAFVDEDGRRGGAPPLDWGLTAAFHDLNGDGFPDLYVCNDYWTPDRIWINDGKGHFRAIPKLALRNMSASSMGVDFADIDRDGQVDFFVVDMLSRDPRLRKRQMPAQAPRVLPAGAIDNRPQFMRNTLAHNRGDGSFEEIANYAGLSAADWAWSPIFIDVDLDGFEDLLISAGHTKDVQDLDASREISARQRSYSGFTNAVERQQAFTRDKMANARLYPRLDMPIIAYRNLGNLKFEEATTVWGTEQLGVHHAMAMADFDNDGDLDFVVNNLGGALGAYRNNSGAPRIAVRLKGIAPNTQGIGAKITLWNGAVPRQSQEVTSGGRYMAGSDPELVFAAGGSREMSLEVVWRSGRRSRLSGVVPNRVYEVAESLSRAEPGGQAVPKTNIVPLFEDVSALLGHVHHDDSFNDFVRQPLLPRKLSQLGPGLAWGDLNNDGRADLIVGGGTGGRMAIFLNHGAGTFERVPDTGAVLRRDQTALLTIQNPDGTERVLAGLSNYEDGLASGPAGQEWGLPSTNLPIDQSTRPLVTREAFPAFGSSIGPLAVADLKGDGNLSLFVGGRVVPGRYPQSADSQLCRLEGGVWKLDLRNTERLRGAGLVSGSIWSDLNGDGIPELILACEWGPIRVFGLKAGELREITAEMGLAEFTGCWNGVTTGDFDGDGRLDIAASNWGLNTPWRATREQPLQLYYGDLMGQGNLDVIEVEYDAVTREPTPRRRLNVLANSLPFLAERFPSFKAFSEAPIGVAFAAEQPRLNAVSARALASMVFFNRGNKFERRELPRDAQLAPAFSISVADFDGDGSEDLFLSQNFFANEPETPRFDAGRGLLLKGDGQGGFSALTAIESGIAVYGEQRGVGVADFNEDGRTDLAVAQNGGATRLFLNKGARPGLRIRLRGVPGNPRGIGAALRWRMGAQLGPVREIHGGSGYLSQDSPVQILCPPRDAERLWIRWPGGRVTTTEISAKTGEVTIDFDGKVVFSSQRLAP